MFSLLSDEEMERLDAFLLDRIDEDADIVGKDEGVLDISELDGLFTAIVSGPVMIPPSQWLPVVWGDCEPVFLESNVRGKISTIVDEWCEGYAQGVALAAAQWGAGGQAMTILLTPILSFTSKTDWRGHDFNADEVENIQQAITPNVREIHAYWLARREEFSSSAIPIQRSEPRVGRNDPCPCGSGRKYKRCCLQ